MRRCRVRTLVSVSGAVLSGSGPSIRTSFTTPLSSAALPAASSPAAVSPAASFLAASSPAASSPVASFACHETHTHARTHAHHKKKKGRNTVNRVRFVCIDLCYCRRRNLKGWLCFDEACWCVPLWLLQLLHRRCCRYRAIVWARLGSFDSVCHRTHILVASTAFVWPQLSQCTPVFGTSTRAYATRVDLFLDARCRAGAMQSDLSPLVWGVSAANAFTQGYAYGGIPVVCPLV